MLTLSSWPSDTSEPILDSTIAGILRDAAAHAPDRVALVSGTPDPAGRRRLSYRDLCRQAEAVARALAARLTPGERVAVMAPSTLESFVLSFAVAMARLVLVPVNPALRQHEVAHVLQKSGAAALFHVDEHRGNDIAGIVANLRPSLGALREVIVFDEWPALVAAGLADDRELPPPAPDDVALIVFTSGTTGAPKGAMLSHRGMCNAARLGGARFGLAPGDVYVNTIPMFHVGGQVIAFEIVQALATDVLVAQFEPGLVLDLLDGERATHTIGVPSMLQAVIARPDFTRRDLSALRGLSTGGASVPAELVRHLERTLGVRSTVVFGQTETCGWVSQTFLDDAPEDKATTVGRPLPQLEVRVVHPEGGQIVPLGEVGELQVRGFNVMLGYLDSSEATATTIDPDGWLHTGDLATMDARGYLKIAGRLKDMIVTGGVNVYPAEIEAVIATHPSVAAAAVLGVPDAEWGEAVVAVVLAADGAQVDPWELDEFTRQRLAPFKAPKRWVVADSLPMNASGKVQKFLLREMLQQELA